jgi:Domain of Unknown Function with PDB structure (DUF3857)
MKALLFFVLSSQFIHSIYCQEALPESSATMKSDLLLTECAFDSSSAAYKLLDYGKVWFEKSEIASNVQRMFNGRIRLKTVTERKVRIKILKAKALNLANIIIPYFADDEKLKEVDGCTYNLDENGNVIISRVGITDVYRRKSPSGSNELVMLLPAVKVGSVIEYKYTLHAEDEGYVRDWYFQDEIPTRVSYYNISLPQVYDFAEETFLRQPADIEQKTEQGFYGSGQFSMKVPVLKKTIIVKNIPALNIEPYMSSANDYLQRILYHRMPEPDTDSNEPGSIALWRELAVIYEKRMDLSKQLSVPVPQTQALIPAMQKEKDTSVIIQAFCSFINSKIGLNKEVNIFSLENMHSVWEKRKGSQAEINIMLINLLRKANIMAYPMLSSTVENGAVLPEVASYRQFNILLTCIPADSGFYIINAADKLQHISLTPYEVLTSTGLLIDGANSRLIDLQDVKQPYRQMTSVYLAVQKDGTAAGQAIISSGGYARAERLGIWEKDPKKSGEQFLNYANATLTVDSLKVSNEADDRKSFDQTAWFNMKLSNSGNYYYVSTNLFTGLSENPFNASQRLSAVNFRYLQHYDIYLSIALPEGFVFEDLPENKTIMMSDKSIIFSRQLSASVNLLNIKMQLDFSKAVYPASEYDALRDYYKKMYNLLAEQVVIKKVK